MIKLAVRAALVAALTLTAGAAHAVAIPLSAKVAGVQYGMGSGLAGRFYDQNISDPVGAHGTIYGSTPQGTFKSTTIDYCCGSDTRTVVNFLGSDGASFQGTDPGDFSGTVLTFDGYLNVTNAYDYDPNTVGVQMYIAVSSDDGFDLKVGGVSAGSSGARGYGTSVMLLDFSSAGLYSFSLLYFENAGQDGLNVSFIPPGTQQLQTLGKGAFYQTATGAPEPAMIGLLGLGALGLAVARRRR